MPPKLSLFVEIKERSVWKSSRQDTFNWSPALDKRTILLNNPQLCSTEINLAIQNTNRFCGHTICSWSFSGKSDCRVWLRMQLVAPPSLLLKGKAFFWHANLFARLPPCVSPNLQPSATGGWRKLQCQHGQVRLDPRLSVVVMRVMEWRTREPLKNLAHDLSSSQDVCGDGDCSWKLVQFQTASTFNGALYAQYAK